MRRGVAWLAAVPLMLGGSQLAHAVAYRLVYPQAHVRVVHMLVRVRRRLVRMLVLMPLGEVQPHADAHQPRRGPQRGAGTLIQQP